MPISPVLAFSFMNDHVPEERSKALAWCEKLVSMCDEIWFFGDWQNSQGCIIERNVALMEFIPIYEIVGWDGDRPLFGRGGKPTWIKTPS